MFKVLVLEDSENDIELLKEVILRLNYHAKEEKYVYERAKNVDEALDILDKAKFDGIIVDISLRTEVDKDGMPNGKDGTDFINSATLEYRIPIAVYSGTPDDDVIVKTFKKGSSDYEDVLRYLEQMQGSKLFDVIGGKGLFEKEMSRIFWNNLFPQADIWSMYAQSDSFAENKLLRYALCHMLEILDESLEYYSEEMYIKPSVVDVIKTGCIIVDKDSKKQIVLSPPCDLAVHNKKIKTETIITCDIEPISHHTAKIYQVAKINAKKQDIKVEDKRVEAVENAKSEGVNKLVTNRFSDYYHWLPKNKLFEGGVINFRKVNQISRDSLGQFDYKSIKVQDAFVKNIQNRFSMYYARQGQPDFNFSVECEKIMEEFKEK